MASTIEIAPIAEKALIATIAVEHNGYVLARQLRYIKCWNRRGVGKRLAVVVDDTIDDFQAVGANYEFMMIRLVSTGNHSRILSLIIDLLVEADRESSNGDIRADCHHGNDRRAVDASRQERTDRNVADHPQARRFAQLLDQFFQQNFPGSRARTRGMRKPIVHTHA